MTETPRRIFLSGDARKRMAAVAAACSAATSRAILVRAAHSLKTNPRVELLALAREHGFFAETISNEERDWARRNGFAWSEMVANGPEPVAESAGPVAYAFADSVEAWTANSRRAVARCEGVRLRPSMVPSRFGVPIEDDAALRRAAAVTPGVPIAVSFHARREDFRGATWRDVAGDVVERAVALGRASGRIVIAFDAGGGWTPQEFDEVFAADLGWLTELLSATLPEVREVLVEPGQAVSTPTEALLTTVLEVRERRGRREAIVDAAYSDWPQMHTYVHPLYAWRDDGWRRLPPGPDRIGGRTCLEYDVIDGVRLPVDCTAGDRLLIGDTGSYDRSMAFDFARGEQPSGPESR